MEPLWGVWCWNLVLPALLFDVAAARTDSHDFFVHDFLPKSTVEIQDFLKVTVRRLDCLTSTGSPPRLRVTTKISVALYWKNKSPTL